MKKQIKKQKRILKGEIVSDKMDKTVVVKVSRLKVRYRISRNFKAHDEKNEYHMGDKVIIQETRPLSKEKRWIVKKKEQVVSNKKEEV